jgi:cytochrome c biogenesis protein CcmG, thiol:disulfide interchange protein DsbE
MNVMAHGKQRIALLAVVAACVAAVGVVLGGGLGHDPTLIRSPLLGRTAPDFTAPSVFGGAPVRLSALRGHVVVLTFWASWCAECHQEQATLNSAWERYRSDDVSFVGVSFEDSASDARDYLASTATRWPAVQDAGSRAAIAYGVSGVPETFFIDKSGRVAAKQIGAVSAATLDRTVTSLLRNGSSS